MILFREQKKKYYFELAISYTGANSAPTKLVLLLTRQVFATYRAFWPHARPT